MNSRLIGMMAHTSIHAGAGQSLGALDLPIQREGHSGWPCIYGSAVKGALRARAEADKLEPIDVIFGPDTKNAKEHAGALLVGDARLLLLPVRSLTGHFKWVTCPAILTRLCRDAERAGYKKLDTSNVSKIESTNIPEEGAFVAPAAQTGSLYLEEYLFTAQSDDNLTSICGLISSFVTRNKFVNELEKQLVVVSDDMFAYLANYATPVAPHIAINSATKTVVDGALWYEETLPPETLLYTLISAQPARKADCEMSAENVLTSVTETLFNKKHIQFGGNETVGMGWCHMAVVTDEARPTKAEG